MSTLLSETIETVIGARLTPRLKASGFRRKGSSFVRTIDDGLIQIVRVEAVRGRAHSFRITVAVTSAKVVFFWTGKRERYPALTGDWLESWRLEEVTGEARHHEFHAEDPAVGLALERAADKLIAALRREEYASLGAILRRVKTPAQQAAILQFLGREQEARELLERALEREKKQRDSSRPPGSTDAARQAIASLTAQLRRCGQPASERPVRR